MTVSGMELVELAMVTGSGGEETAIASQVDADDPLVEDEMDEGALGELLLSLPLPPPVVVGLSGESSRESPVRILLLPLLVVVVVVAVMMEPVAPVRPSMTIVPRTEVSFIMVECFCSTASGLHKLLHLTGAGPFYTCPDECHYDAFFTVQREGFD